MKFVHLFLYHLFFYLHSIMSSRTIFLKNYPTERKLGEKIVLMNVIAAKKIVLLAVMLLKNNDFL